MQMLREVILLSLQGHVIKFQKTCARPASDVVSSWNRIMRSLTPFIVPFFLLSTLSAQEHREDLFTRPTVPQKEVLDRLHLTLEWQKRIPMLSKKDGIFSCQTAWIFSPDNKFKQLDLIIQTRSGLVLSMNADTGRLRWQTRVGNLYQVTQPAGFNNLQVVVIRETELHGLSRITGKTLWRIELPGVATTPPVVDEEHVFVALGARNVYAYNLPARGATKPSQDWRYRSLIPLEMAPSLTRNFLIMPSSVGTVLVLEKDRPKEFRRSEMKDRLLAPASVHAKEAVLYLGSRDSTARADTIEPSLTAEPWRYLAGGAVSRPPFVTDESVYFVSKGAGLSRVLRRSLSGTEVAKILVNRGYVDPVALEKVRKDLRDEANNARVLLDQLEIRRLLTRRQRESIQWQGGVSLWSSRTGDRVAAVNPKFVYAIDHRGYLLVLDRKQGRQLSRFNVREFVYPITNSATDRLYLAAHDGTLICLRDKAYNLPQVMQTPLEPFIPKPIVKP